MFLYFLKNKKSRGDFLELIELSNFNEEQLEIIRLIGMSNYLILLEYFSGETVYFPKMKSLKIQERNVKIKKEFNGKNFYSLSKKYNLCERQVRRIVKDFR